VDDDLRGSPSARRVTRVVNQRVTPLSRRSEGGVERSKALEKTKHVKIPENWYLSKGFVTINDLVETLGIDRSTAYRWAKSGKVRTQTIGNRTVFDCTGLKGFLFQKGYDDKEALMNLFDRAVIHRDSSILKTFPKIAKKHRTRNVAALLEALRDYDRAIQAFEMNHNERPSPEAVEFIRRTHRKVADRLEVVLTSFEFENGSSS
jgi:hypothetical protein